MSDNIKAFPASTEQPENPMQIAPRHPVWCDHARIVLDAHTRSVQCADPKCGAVLEPFDFLLKNAMTIQRAWEAHAHAMRQANEVAERVTALKKEEQRLRAMIKRLQDKSGAVLDVRNR